MLERRGGYQGDADLVVEDVGSFPVNVTLTGYVDVSVVETLGEPPRNFDGPQSWRGLIVAGLSESELYRILGKRMQIRLNNGSTGGVALRDGKGTLSGYGPAPFPIQRHDD